MKEGFRWCPHCRDPHALASRFCASTGKPLDRTLHEPNATPVVVPHPRAGMVLDGRYEVVRRVGTGGMNEVFEGLERNTGQRVAVKIIKEKVADAAARLHREAEIIASLRHPNICALLGSGITPDARPYLVFELLEGETLADKLHGRKRLSVALALALFTQLLAGLGRAHERGIIHRDLKPANIFLVDAGGAVPLVKILDFGLAMDILRRSSRMTRPGRAAGTPRYMAPEQLIGAAVSPAADLFALAMMLYEALAGEHPFRAPTAQETFRRIINDQEIDLARCRTDLPFGLTAIVHAALSKRVADRPRSAGQMLHALSMLGIVEEEEPASVDSMTYRMAAPSSGPGR